MNKKQLPSEREIVPMSPESAPKLRATFTDEFKRDAVARLRAGNQNATAFQKKSARQSMPRATRCGEPPAASV
ncbi:hypothetical protein [Janthinobacterium sp. UMAB-56]|uniref:hypothetical protein n=1 Tax=Janthinobacterium sp. UMAB-56 TaxID=1365361 RepID=UPI001C5A516F|nr:hypothetical protein [Janthinobacterium sp. UMAB-56]